MFHGHAWGFPFVSAMNGAEIVLPGRDLSPQHLAKLLLDYYITFTCGVPTIWLTLYDELMKAKAARGGKLDLSHCRVVTSGFACPDFVVKSTNDSNLCLFANFAKTMSANSAST